MCPKEGTRIELQRERYVRFCQICQICRFRFVKFVRFANFRDLKNRETNRRTDRPSYRDAWTHLKTRVEYLYSPTMVPLNTLEIQCVSILVKTYMEQHLWYNTDQLSIFDAMLGRFYLLRGPGPELGARPSFSHLHKHIYLFIFPLSIYLSIYFSLSFFSPFSLSFLSFLIVFPLFFSFFSPSSFC